MNEEYREKTQRVYILMEIIYTFLDHHLSWYYVGSLVEGIFTPGENFCLCKRMIWFVYSVLKIISRK